ncbi:class I SAM-dependent methyltransferase [Ureibacillus acetophenoni]|uniref:Methyltransferase family protein n=1 Tax=Ureibacillus acetophenoni TaxID=614649 RepID=A0A285UJ98_9BACL|nr:class I SAM-dependent methyltransferase [Ureibacillus acetophenoni]SOC41757.1 methyltransferase family protein [Ureibacillus acetophenoni]
MELNKIEFYMMNNPIRRWLQKSIELKTFKEFLDRHNFSLEGKAVLDAGCGSGYSTKLIQEFRPAELVGFDIMPSQIDKAKKEYPDLNFFVGSVLETHLDSNKFDAVFVFGILHHIPQWKDAIIELYRVLKPGGVLLVEDLNKDASHFFATYFKLDHPPEAYFTWDEFTHQLEETGFDILEQKRIISKGVGSFLCLKSGGNK